MITCGVDIGSRTIKVVLFDGQQVIDSAVTLSGAAPREKAEQMFHDILAINHIQRSDVAFIMATGYGRQYFTLADKASSEIICHTAGVHFLYPQVKTIIDIGGQDSKVMNVSAQGKVTDFVMNDRCAAGTGKFIEMVAQTLDMPLDRTGPEALSTNDICDISSMCAVFAESEVIGLLHQGRSSAVILRGVFRSVAKRIASLGRKIGFREPVVFTGGVARNPGVLAAIGEQIDHPDIRVPENPQLTGALGAAVLGFEKARQTQG
ncbi:acyl-CoA dehydratase activase [Vibrio quintilis]|uniref:R-phenyllactate dehydratase activator n=1 Tax=Vibrio quintilis TaxID=1117707 RepID=A0A1M7YZZ5_9VIBR|nr:acyl-CoA dehydratase activase [Vibrio quintilis]SHO58211.1 R-phenyllactate dehydratase activator [Vibrio quintilis]